LVRKKGLKGPRTVRSGKMGKQFVEGEGDEGTKGKRKRNYGVMKNE
jgi:hypothetical protein